MVTPIYAALLGLMLIGLSVNVIKGRRKFGAGLGDADNIEMKRRIRAQANLAEYAPMFLILLGYAEHNGLPLWAVHVLGIIFLAGRVMHAYSVLKAEQYDQHKLTANPIWRIRGMICTFNMIGILALIILVQSVM
ncbi:MAG: glutathione metabolism protein [Alphaproteobacteria bacterium]|nr:glutathione metabolism protein [Alphaproteobacteria bacterium]